MRYLSLALLSPTLLVLVWLYWTFPKDAFPRKRRLYDLVVIGMTLGACVFTSMHIDATMVSPALDGFGRRSGQIWSQVKPALCGYGVAMALLGLGMLVRSLLWRRDRSRSASS